MTIDVNDEQKVVSLMGMLEENRFSAITDLETYWNDLRGNRALPYRSDIDPRKIEDCLEYAFIVERISSGLARFRLAGNHLNELIGMEVRGMPLASIFAPEGRPALTEVLETVFSGPSVVTLTLEAVAGPYKPPLEGRMVLLPLRSDFGDVTRALGVLVTQGEIGSPSRKFTCTNSIVNTIEGVGIETKTPDVYQPKTRIPTKEAAAVTGFTEPAATYTSIPATGKTIRDGKVRPHIYLVSSNDS